MGVEHGGAAQSHVHTNSSGSAQEYRSSFAVRCSAYFHTQHQVLPSHIDHVIHGDHGGIFQDVNSAKRHSVDLTEQENEQFSDNFFGKIAKNKTFEWTTMSLICINALAIGYEADYSARFHKADNLYDGPLQFIVIENIFATYFTAEVLIRFLAYKNKAHCVCDMWFVFDGTLVVMMVAETWILPFVSDGGPMAQLSILRLLRLLRITRMARLMRSLPELMLIVKGMAAAVRAVVWTVVLMILVTLVFAILFTSEYHQGKLTDDECADPGDDVILPGNGAEVDFGSMGKSFFTLFIMGTILDDVTYAYYNIRDSETILMSMAFVFFITLANFMMLNMLLGILVEVVANTGDGEKERIKELNFRDAVSDILVSLDQNFDKRVTKEEFYQMKDHKTIKTALEDMGIKEDHLEQYAKLFYQGGDGTDGSLTYDQIQNMIVRLNPSAMVSALDFAALSKCVMVQRHGLKERIGHVEKILKERMRKRKLQTSQATPSAGSTGSSAPNGPMISTSEGSPQQNVMCPGVVPEEGRQYPASMPASLREHGRIGIHTLALLETTGSELILEELERRLGIQDLGKMGVPLSMLDDELQRRVKAAEGFQTLSSPQSNPETAEGCAALPHSIP